MIIQQDTREQAGKKDHILRYFESQGVKVVRSKMYCGDWTRLDNQTVCIDTKGGGLQEVYNNLVGYKSHERFKRECIRAQEAGIRLIILIEQKGVHALKDVAGWKNDRIGYYEYLKLAHEHGKLTNRPLPKAPPISSERLMNIMITMSNRYGCEWRFCEKKDAGAEIIRLLGGG